MLNVPEVLHAIVQSSHKYTLSALTMNGILTILFEKIWRSSSNAI